MSLCARRILKRDNKGHGTDTAGNIAPSVAIGFTGFVSIFCEMPDHHK